MHLTIAVCGNYMINNQACLTYLCCLDPSSLYSFQLLKFQHILKFPSLLSHFSLSLAVLSVFNGQETTPPLFLYHSNSFSASIVVSSLAELPRAVKCHSGPPWSTLQIGSFVLRTKEIVPQLPFGEKCIKTNPIWN